MHLQIYNEKEGAHDVFYPCWSSLLLFLLSPTPERELKK